MVQEALVETGLLERMSSESDDRALRVWFLIVVKLASLSEEEMLNIPSRDRIWPFVYGYQQRAKVSDTLVLMKQRRFLYKAPMVFRLGPDPL